MPCLQRRLIGRPIHNLLPCSIEAWDNDCWSQVIEERPGLIKDIYPPQRLNSTAWVVGLVQQGNRRMAWSHQRQIPPQSLNSTVWVVGLVSSKTDMAWSNEVIDKI